MSGMGAVSMDSLGIMCIQHVHEPFNHQQPFAPSELGISLYLEPISMAMSMKKVMACLVAIIAVVFGIISSLNQFMGDKLTIAHH